MLNLVKLAVEIPVAWEKVNKLLKITGVIGVNLEVIHPWCKAAIDMNNWRISC
jgi:hypothetical protein